MRDVNFEKLTKRAISIYTQERAALLKGDRETLRKASKLKAALLSDIEAAENRMSKSAENPELIQCRAELKSLRSIIARRISENDQLARANQSTSQGSWPNG